MKKIILTGFEPFGGENSNPAFDAIKLVSDKILDVEIVKLEIPVVFDKGANKILELVEELEKEEKELEEKELEEEELVEKELVEKELLEKELVEEELVEKKEDLNFNNNILAILNIGQAGGRSCMTIEKVAINLAEARIPDNLGNQPLDTAIKEDGETAYFTTLPIKSIVYEMRKNNIPANISYTAGTYVCNDVMYQMLYYTSKKNINIKTGFIHVPYAPSQVIDKPNGTPFMTLDMIASGIEIAIQSIIKNKVDLEVNIGGETH